MNCIHSNNLGSRRTSTERVVSAAVRLTSFFINCDSGRTPMFVVLLPKVLFCRYVVSDQFRGREELQVAPPAKRQERDSVHGTSESRIQCHSPRRSQGVGSVGSPDSDSLIRSQGWRYGIRRT